MPRRIGSERQMPDRSVRSRATKSEAGVRPGPVPGGLDAQLVVGGPAGHPVGHPGAHHDRDDRDARAASSSSPARAASRPAAPASTASTTRSVGLLSSSGVSRPVTTSSATRPPTATAVPRTTWEPLGPRRSHSTTQARHWAMTVPVNSHRNTGAIATGSSGRAPTAYDVAASSVQHCSSQAMFSGAISSAPRWSVVGLTGNATAWCARQQLAAAAGRRRRDQGDHQHADVGGGQQDAARPGG